MYRATTHNKGIYNGIDAVAIATGNDFRAIEAAGHTYASRNGQYESLSRVEIENDTFRLSLKFRWRLAPWAGSPPYTRLQNNRCTCLVTQRHPS